MIFPEVIQRKKLHAVGNLPLRRGFSPTSRDLLSVGGSEGSSTSLAPRMTVAPNSLKSYLFECCVVMNSATLRGEAGPLKNFAVLLPHETVRNFAARRGPAILADVVKAISQFIPSYHIDSMTW